MKIHNLKKRSRFITTYIIAGGILSIIIIGTLLLHLPFASATGESVPWLDSLFTATTAVCVTGLVTVTTATSWSFWGQLIILFLIQIGGLGIISFTVLFLKTMKRRISLRQRILIRDAYNLNTYNGLVDMVRKIVKGTFLVEVIGAVLYSFVFIPEFGPWGIWKSIFNSVSAFCNAGMDVLGESSLIPYRDNLCVNLTTIALIILGGIGFPIWFLTIEKIKEMKNKKVGFVKVCKELPAYAKVVFITSFALIAVGAVIIFGMEFNNDATIGKLPLGEKILASCFQSVTTRTAGFCTIPQEGLRGCTVIICSILMFIGGSPSGTAGGIKTTTVAILILSLISALSERNDTEVFKRKVSADTVRKAMSIFLLSFFVMIASLTALCMVQPGSFEDCLYEVISSIGTVGLSRNLTSSLTAGGKLVIIATMYLGRIGPISLALFFNTKKYVNSIQYPEENIPIG